MSHHEPWSQWSESWAQFTANQHDSDSRVISVSSGHGSESDRPFVAGPGSRPRPGPGCTANHSLARQPGPARGGLTRRQLTSRTRSSSSLLPPLSRVHWHPSPGPSAGT
eukprot:501762-Rhodomonas_salina.3